MLKISRCYIHSVPRPQSPPPPPPPLPNTPHTKLSHTTLLTPHAAARRPDRKMKNSPKTQRNNKNKKTIFKQKIEDKKTLPDIRKFWKTIDDGDKDISRQ